MKKSHRPRKGKPRYQPENNPMNDEWLDSQDVMQRLRIRPRTLYKLRKTGELPYYKLNGKILFKRSEVDAMVEKCRVVV